MTLMTRISRLFKADFHAVMDTIEEPEVLLRQAVRDMEEALDASAQRLIFLQDQIDKQSHQIQSTRTQQDQFTDEIELCFQSGNCSMARNFIRRKLELTSSLNSLLVSKDALFDAQRKLQKEQDENQSTYQSMKQKSDLLWRDRQLHNTDKQCSINPSLHIHDDDIEVAFIKEKQRFDALNPNVGPSVNSEEFDQAKKGASK